MNTLIKYCLLLSLPLFSQAQTEDFVIERFTSEDGLPSQILDIVQDDEGFIWFGTEEGLVKYDGYEFHFYRNIPGDSTSLTENRIEKLYVDHVGDLWVGTKAGLDRYESLCDCFFRYSNNESAPNNQLAGQINAFTEDQDSNLWIGAQNGGLFRYDRESDHFTRFLDDPSDSNNLLDDDVRILLADRNNFLWIGTGEPFDLSVTGGGLIRYDLTTGDTRRFLYDPENPNSLIDNRVSALMEDRNGKLWVGTCQSGLHYYVPDKEEFVRMMPDPDDPNKLCAPQGGMGMWSSCPHVRFIHENQDGSLWVGTFNGGLNHYNPSTNKLTLYEHEPENPQSLNNNMVWSFFQDRQGRYWIGNLTGGLHKIDPSSHKFKVYTHDPKDPSGLSFNSVLGIYEAPTQEGIIWLGTRGGGLNRLDSKSNRFTNFRHNPGDKHSISNDIVWTTYEDIDSTFWVGTESGLEVLDRQTGKFNHYEIIENGTSRAFSDPIMQIHEDAKGTLWLGIWGGGIVRLNRNDHTIKRYSFSDEDPQTFYNSGYTIFEDTKGMIWAGTFQGGLYQFDVLNDHFIPHLAGYGALAMQEDSSGAFWVGSANSGIIHFSPTEGIMRQYTSANGLPSNIVYGILADNKDDYWLSTGNGISKFNPNSNHFTNYDGSDGLPFTSFNPTSGFKASDGSMYFGGEGGLIAFYPDQVKGNLYPPDVLLTDLEISGARYDIKKQTTDPSRPVTLSYKQNDLTFEYVGLHYTDPSRNKYKYTLHPYDVDWINAGSQRTARYTNLDPGEYTFQVIASSSDGVWNEKGASLSVIIRSSWWTRWWAYGLFIGLLLGLIYWFYHFQLSRKLAVAESLRLKEVNQLKNSLYTNITHEFRTPLTVILGMAGAAQSEVEEKSPGVVSNSLELIRRNGENLLHLVNQMLDLARLDSGYLELQLIKADVVPFIKYLCESFHSMAREKNINLTVYAEIEELVMDFDPAKLSTVVSNLISNAIKFTQDDGKIIVHLNSTSSGEKEYFLLKIIDNGKGLSKDEIHHVFDRFYQGDDSLVRQHEGTGIGLALTMEFVGLMGGNIDVKSELDKGSEFIVHLPVTRDASPMEGAPTEIAISKRRLYSGNGHDIASVIDDITSDLPRILIIEDNEDIVQYLKTCLHGKYQCTHVKDGQRGIERALEEIPDIIICDVMMPGKDGFEVCATLKADVRTDHIPIIILTAKATHKDRLTGLSHGADAYLTKPFSKAELLTRLDQLILLRQKMMKKLQEGSFNRFLKQRVENPETKFIQKAVKIIHQNIDNHLMGSAFLSQKMNLSESQLYRKLKAITGKSTAIFIRSVRLQMAKELIQSTDKSISEIAYSVGFSDPSWFSRAFKEEFGFAPSELIK